MPARKILLLGDPTLLKRSTLVKRRELPEIHFVIEDLHDTLMQFRSEHGVGRAIAAPQIGVAKRLIYMHIDKPMVFMNPVFDQKSREKMELWDDCMSFPDLLVRVRRHKRCRITFRDEQWKKQTMALEGDLSELLQHEVDHLDGILAVSRAIDGSSFALRKTLTSL